MDNSVGSIIYWGLLLAPAILGIWGIQRVATAVRRSHRVQGSLGIAFALSVYIGGAAMTDYRVMRTTEQQIEACREHLEVVGRAMVQYRQQQNRMPPNLMELYRTMQIPLSPVHAKEADSGYIYQLPRGSSEKQMVAWDAKPHVYRFKYLKFLRRVYRNVLLLDGTVLTLEESEIPIMSVRSGR